MNIGDPKVKRKQLLLYIYVITLFYLYEAEHLYVFVKEVGVVYI